VASKEKSNSRVVLLMFSKSPSPSILIPGPSPLTRASQVESSGGGYLYWNVAAVGIKEGCVVGYNDSLCRIDDGLGEIVSSLLLSSSTPRLVERMTNQVISTAMPSSKNPKRTRTQVFWQHELFLMVVAAAFFSSSSL